MPNEIQIECYFKSSEMAALCKRGKDIIINFKASYPPDSKPTFEIYADSFNKGVKAGKKTKIAVAADTTPTTGGCPKPC
jgi:hypothetical protein